MTTFWLTAPPLERGRFRDEPVERLRVREVADGIRLERFRGDDRLDLVLDLPVGRTGYDAEARLRRFQAFIGRGELPRRVTGARSGPQDPAPINFDMGVSLLVLAELASSEQFQGNALSIDDLLRGGVFESHDVGSVYKYLSQSFSDDLPWDALVHVEPGEPGRKPVGRSPDPNRQRRAYVQHAIKVEYIWPEGQQDRAEVTECGLDRLACWLKSVFQRTITLQSTYYPNLHARPESDGVPTRRAHVHREFSLITEEEARGIKEYIGKLQDNGIFGRPADLPTWSTWLAHEADRSTEPILLGLHSYIEVASPSEVLECLRSFQPPSFYGGRYYYWRGLSVRVHELYRGHDEIDAHALLMMGSSAFHLGRTKEAERSIHRVVGMAHRRGWLRLKFLSWFIAADHADVEGDFAGALRERLRFHVEVDRYLDGKSQGLTTADMDVLRSLARYNVRATAVQYARVGDDAKSDEWFSRIESQRDRYGVDIGKWRADAMIVETDIAICQGRTDRVQTMLDEAKAIFREWGDYRWLCAALHREAIFYELTDRHPAAKGVWAQLETHAKDLYLLRLAYFAREKLTALDLALNGRGARNPIILTSRSSRHDIAKQLAKGNLP